MTLATKNGAIILKDGKLAEDCGCCGGWYCVGGECGVSCASGSYPSAILTSVTMTVNDGSVTFPAKLRLESTVSLNIGACASYGFSVGAGANPNSTGFSDQPTPVIQFTFQDIGPPVSASFDVPVGISVIFGGACFRAFEDSTLTPNQFSVSLTDFHSARGGGFLWNLISSPLVGPALASNSSPLCYADWPGWSNAQITGGTFAKQYAGTISLSVLSVE